MIHALLSEVRTFLEDLRREFPGMFVPARSPGPPPRRSPGKRLRPIPGPQGRHAAATELRETVSLRLAFWSDKLGLRYRKVFIKNQRTRWASCSKKGNLNFNWRLLWAPPEVLDYVIVHELCHLVEMNHSPRFWAQVALWCPDYKKHRKWLRVHGRDLGRGPRPEAAIAAPGAVSLSHALDVDGDLHLVAEQRPAGV